MSEFDIEAAKRYLRELQTHSRSVTNAEAAVLWISAIREIERLEATIDRLDAQIRFGVQETEK